LSDEFLGDEIGPWSEIKLSIIREYASAYSQILSAQKSPKLEHVYIDAFSGAGVHRRRRSGQQVPGSAAIALKVTPPFREYHFIDLNGKKLGALRKLLKDRSDAFAYKGDCNKVLLEQVFPRVRFEDYRRGLCLLDPYGMQLQWETIAAAAEMKSIELFLNFPIGPMNRNVLLKNYDAIEPKDAAAMSVVWGDNTWREVAYRREPGLFEEMREREDYGEVAKAFQSRLVKVAGFEHVPKPVLMRNSQGAPLYYLYFASHKPVAAKIVRDIFDKYRKAEGI